MENQQKPRLLFVITQGTWGGAQKYVHDLVINLTSDFDVAVAIGEPDGKKDLQESLTNIRNVPSIVQLKHLVRDISPLHDLEAPRELADLYNEFKPHVVCLNSSKAGVLGSLAKLVSTHKPKIVYTVHGWAFLEPGFSKTVYYLAELLTSHLKDAFIVLSEKEKKIAQQRLHIDEKKLTVIRHSSVPAHEHHVPKNSARTSLSEQLTTTPSADSKWIGTIASLYKTKGLHYLVKAAADVHKKNSNVHFFVIGEGPEWNTLTKLISQNKAEGYVHLVGSLINAATYLSAFDIFVLSSVKEGDPYVIQEALQAGLPIVATMVGSIPERITHGENGMLVPPGNSHALAQAIEMLLSDTQKREALATNALTTSKSKQTKNSFEQFVTSTKNLFLNLAA